MAGPVVEQLSQIMEGKLKVAKLNVDEIWNRSISSLLLFKNGKGIAITVGAAPEGAYQRFTEQWLSKN